jgi:hypothetical protein
MVSLGWWFNRQSIVPKVVSFIQKTKKRRKKRNGSIEFGHFHVHRVLDRGLEKYLYIRRNFKISKYYFDLTGNVLIEIASVENDIVYYNSYSSVILPPLQPHQRLFYIFQVSYYFSAARRPSVRRFFLKNRLETQTFDRAQFSQW